MSESIFVNFPLSKVIDTDGKYISIDLSVNNLDLKTLENAIDFEHYIERFLKNNHAEVAYGGYNEERNLYKRSAIFNGSDDAERNIHIGIDLWIKSGTKVFAAFDGKVHSFNVNGGIGNYGPTIILEHVVNNVSFYTLYGHLSLESIQNLNVGNYFESGQKLGTLGDANVNGDYAPHLHFQVIKNIGDWKGDYPGVCTKNERDFYLENCPNPNLFIKLN